MRSMVSLMTVASLLLCGAAGAVEGVSPTPAGDDVAPAPGRALKSPEVAEVQARLKALGFAVGPVDGRLGTKTRKAINAYLTQRGLPPTGWIPPDLITEVEGVGGNPVPPAAESRPHSAIVHESLRETDPAKVMVVQRRLKQLGYYTGPVDGVVGSRLTDAIKDYQTAAKTPVTGWIFPDLVIEMEAGLNAAPATPVEEPVPAPVVVRTWSPKDLIGLGLHARAGDLIGRVVDVVVGRDGLVAGVVGAIQGLYGDAAGETLIPWAQVAPSVGRPAVILPLSADQERPLRRQPPPLVLGSDQMLGSGLSGARVRVDGRRWGRVVNPVFSQDGKLARMTVRGSDSDAVVEVPAAGLSLVPEDRAVDLKEAPDLSRFESGAS